jgi:hypothetical protein
MIGFYVANVKRIRKGYYGSGFIAALTNIFVNGASIFGEFHVVTAI